MTDTDTDIIATGGFNTGRLYSAAGQRIFWAQLADGWVYVNDTDRMIDGWVRHTGHMHTDGVAMTPAWIMRQYDSNKLEYFHPDHSLPRPRVPAGFDYGASIRI